MNDEERGNPTVSNDEDQLNPPTSAEYCWSVLKDNIEAGQTPREIKEYIERFSDTLKKTPSIEQIENVMGVLKVAKKRNSPQLYEVLCEGGLVTKEMFDFVLNREKLLSFHGFSSNDLGEVSDNIKEAKLIALGFGNLKEGMSIANYLRIIYTPIASSDRPLAPGASPNGSVTHERSIK